MTTYTLALSDEGKVIPRPFERWSYTLDELTTARDARDETSAQAMAATLETFRKIDMARNSMLDRACLIALAKGWYPAECQIVHESRSTGGGREVLEVGGVARFEVNVAFEADDKSCMIRVVTTPRWLAQIPYHPRSPMAQR